MKLFEIVKFNLKRLLSISFCLVAMGFCSEVYADGPLDIAVILDDSLSMLDNILYKDGSTIRSTRKIDILKAHMAPWIESRLEKGDNVYLTGLVPRQAAEKKVLVTEEMKYWDNDSKFVPYPSESIGKTIEIREYSRDPYPGVLETEMRYVAFVPELEKFMKEFSPYMDITPLGYSIYEVSKWLNSQTPKEKKSRMRVLTVTDGIDFFGAESTCENIDRIDQENLLSKEQISLHLIYFLPKDAHELKDTDTQTKKLIEEASRIEKDYLTKVLECTKEMRDWVRVDVIEEGHDLKELIETKTFEPKSEEIIDEKQDDVIEIFNEDIEEMEKIVDEKEITLEELKKEIQDLDLKPIAGSTLNYINDQNLFFTISPDEESIIDKDKELIFFVLRETGSNNFSLIPLTTVAIPSLQYKWMRSSDGMMQGGYDYVIFNDTPYLLLEGIDSEKNKKAIWINLLSFTTEQEKDLGSYNKTTYAHIHSESNDLGLLVRPDILEKPWHYIQVPPGSYSYRKIIHSDGGESYLEVKINENATVSIIELPPMPEEFRNIKLFQSRFEFSGPDTYDFFANGFQHIALDLRKKRWVKKDTFAQLFAHAESLGILPEGGIYEDRLSSNELNSIRIKLKTTDPELFQAYLIQFDRTKQLSDGFVKYEQLIEIDAIKENRELLKFGEPFGNYQDTNFLFGYTPNELIALGKLNDQHKLLITIYSRGRHYGNVVDYTPYFDNIEGNPIKKIYIKDFGVLHDKLILDLEYDGEISRIVYDIVGNKIIDGSPKSKSKFQDINLSDLRDNSGVSGISVEAVFPDKNAMYREVTTTTTMQISNLNAHLNGGRSFESPTRPFLDKFFDEIIPYESRHPELKKKLDSDIYSLDDDEDIPFRVKGLTHVDKATLPGKEIITFYFYKLNDESLKTKSYRLLYIHLDGQSYYGFLKRSYVEKFIVD